MEVLTFFSNNSQLNTYLGKYLKEYPKLQLANETADTLYFENPLTHRNEIYYHPFHNSINHELLRDYSMEEQIYLKENLGNGNFFFFDIQFRDELFLSGLLTSFADYLRGIELFKKDSIWIHHPFKGFFKLE